MMFLRSNRIPSEVACSSASGNSRPRSVSAENLHHYGGSILFDSVVREPARCAFVAQNSSLTLKSEHYASIS